MALKILVAPLDWGLGHATRCLPIINYLLTKNHKVVIATEGKCRKLIESNFPELEILPLRGYRINYSEKKIGFAFKIIRQIPKILKSIRNEKKWLKKIQKEHQFDLIISDNRYGLTIPEVVCIILTHQVNIQTGLGAFSNLFLAKMNTYFLEKFHACWIVDFSGKNGLSGKLGHPKTIPSNSKYIGILSQFEIINEPKIRVEERKEILILLSGPEPMRSVLEEKLIQQLNVLPQYDFILVAGVPNGNSPDNLLPNIQYHTFLPAFQLKNIIENSKLIICRSGYSTLMDLMFLRKNALLIPTPGQTEQEYLARILMEKRICYSVEQSELNLKEDIVKSFSFAGFTNEMREIKPHYQIVLEDLLQSLE